MLCFWYSSIHCDQGCFLSDLVIWNPRVWFHSLREISLLGLGEIKINNSKIFLVQEWLRTEVPCTPSSCRPDWVWNSWPLDHDSAYHATETPSLTTRLSVTSWLLCECKWCSSRIFIFCGIHTYSGLRGKEFYRNFSYSIPNTNSKTAIYHKHNAYFWKSMSYGKHLSTG